MVDYHHTSKATFEEPLEFLNQMILTTSARNAERGLYIFINTYIEKKFLFLLHISFLIFKFEY